MEPEVPRNLHGVLKKMFFEEDRLVGAILIGDISLALKLKKAVALMREYPDLQIRVIAESLGFYDECRRNGGRASRYDE